MIPVERRLPDVRPLIDREHYYVVHAPRQLGKTTCFRALARTLTREGRYAAVHASCETGEPAGDDVERGVSAVLRAVENEALALAQDLRPEPVERFSDIGADSRLERCLATWSRRSTRPVVLFLS